MTVTVWERVVGVSVTVHRTPRDRFGDPLPPVTFTLDQVVLAPTGSSEVADAASTVITGYTMYAPPSSDLRSSDTLTLPDETGTWGVIGEVGVWRNPWDGSTVGVQCRLERATG